MKKNDTRWAEIKFFNPETDKMLSCSCCGQCLIRYDFIKALDKFRELIGIPIIITSGYRCPEHNKSKEVGGLDKYDNTGNHQMSYHCHCIAADFSISNKSLLHIVYKIAISSGLFKGIGLSLAKGFIHADIGSTFERYWIYEFTGGTRILNGKAVNDIMSKGNEYYLKQLKSPDPEKWSKWD